MTTETSLPLELDSQSETSLPLEMPDGSEVLALLAGEDLFGRMSESEGGDVSEWDVLPADQVHITKEMVEETDLFAGEGERPSPFVSLSPAVVRDFPVLVAALQKYSDAESRPGVVRIDDERSYDSFTCERAVKELERQVQAIRDALQEHLDEHAGEEHPGYGRAAKKLAVFDVLGAARSVAQISRARTSSEAVDAMPQIPVEIPKFAQGKVKCWRDGDAIVCSMRFQAADGSGRVATMAAKPQGDAADVLGAAADAGADPITILGALPDLAQAQCARRLVKEVAGAALDAHRRLDVCVMGGEPLLLPAGEADGRAAVAAVMDVQQRADVGDTQACHELEQLEVLGRGAGGKLVGPLVSEARARLAQGRARKIQASRHKPFLSRYAQMGLVL